MLSKYYKKWDDFCKSALMLVIIWGKTLLNLFATTWNVFTIIKAQLKRRETKVEEFYFIFFFFGVGGERWLAGRWWALIFFSFTFMEFFSVRLQVQLLILSSRRRLYHDKIKSQSIKTRYKNVNVLNAAYGPICQWNISFIF